MDKVSILSRRMVLQYFSVVFTIFSTLVQGWLLLKTWHLCKSKLNSSVFKAILVAQITLFLASLSSTSGNIAIMTTNVISDSISFTFTTLVHLAGFIAYLGALACAFISLEFLPVAVNFLHQKETGRFSKRIKHGRRILMFVLFSSFVITITYQALVYVCESIERNLCPSFLDIPWLKWLPVLFPILSTTTQCSIYSFVLYSLVRQKMSAESIHNSILKRACMLPLSLSLLGAAMLVLVNIDNFQEYLYPKPYFVPIMNTAWMIYGQMVIEQSKFTNFKKVVVSKESKKTPTKKETVLSTFPENSSRKDDGGLGDFSNVSRI